MKSIIIKTEEEYKSVMSRIDKIFDAAPGTPEGEELEMLATAVELYESEVCPM